jgi:hypothetical protein
MQTLLPKIIATILENKIEEAVEALGDTVLQQTQQGFRPYRRTTGNILTVKLAMDENRKMNQSMVLTFIDARKALGSVSRKHPVGALSQHSCPEGIIRRVEALHTGHAFITQYNGEGSTKPRQTGMPTRAFTICHSSRGGS